MRFTRGEVVAAVIAATVIIGACARGTGDSEEGTSAAPLTTACGTIPPDCGDGELDRGEWCDDGNNVSGDLCSCDCSSGIDQAGTWEAEDSTGCSPRRIKNTKVLQEYIDSFPTSGGFNNGTPLDLPPNAKIRLCDHDADGVVLHIRKRVLFDGNGSMFIVPRGQNLAADCQLPTTPNVALLVEGDGAASSLEDTVILSTWVPTTQPATDMIAVDIRVANVSIENFRLLNVGTGIRLHDPDGAGPINQNSTMLDRIRIAGCGFAGFYTDGNDSQAGAITRNSVTGCRNSCGTAVAYYESSFLGNSYFANHAEDNDVGYRLRGVGSGNRSTLVGNYIENSDALDVDGVQTSGMAIVGGQLASRYRTAVTLAGAGDSADVIGAAGFSYLRLGGTDAEGNLVQLELPNISRLSAMQFRFVPAGGSSATWPVWQLSAESPKWMPSTTRRGWSFWAEGIPGGSTWATNIQPSFSFYYDDLCYASGFWETHSADITPQTCPQIPSTP